jgi:hypothetical protein
MTQIRYFKNGAVLSCDATEETGEAAHEYAMNETVFNWAHATHFEITEEGGDSIMYDAQDGRQV